MARERAAGNPWRTKEEGALLPAVVLWCVDRLRPLLLTSGLDFALFRELLRVRLLLALRPTRTNSWGLAGIALSLVMTWLAGIGTGLMALLGTDAGAWVVLSQSVLVVLLALMLFQFLAGILVDPTDIGVVAPHPVADRTLFAVRLAEVFAYLLVFTASFTAGNVLLAVFSKPPLAVLFVYPLLSLLCAATTLGAVALLFALCLRIVGPTHFQRVTLWVQILGGMLLFAGSQAPRFARREQWGLWFDEFGWLRFLWPPFQYADTFTLASGGESAAPFAALVSAVLLPALALAATLWLASRYFVAGLQGTLGAPMPRSSWGDSLVTRIGARLTRGPERAGFEFTAALSRREPHFLRGVLPQLMMFQAMSLGIGLGRHRELAMFVPMSAGFLFLVLPNVLMQAQGTPTPEARGLFASAPLADDEALRRGGLKALLVQWVGGPAVLVLCLQLFVAGAEALPRIVLALELAFVGALFFARRYELRVPFTQPIRVGETGAANFALILLSGFALMVLAGVHWALSRHPLALAAGIVACGGLLAVLWRRLDAPARSPRRASSRGAAKGGAAKAGAVDDDGGVESARGPSRRL